MSERDESRAPGVLDEGVLQQVAAEALREDLGSGDITTDSVVPAGARARCALVARQPGTVCGLALAAAVFRVADPSLAVVLHAADGGAVQGGARLLTVAGPARPILSAERVALNFVGRLSGIATLTRAHVEAVAGTGARIMDTRKTTPGLRLLEKWAVACGGGINHRFGLYDGFMLKDNHRAALEAAEVNLVEAVREARRRSGEGIPFVIEVDRAAQIEEALEAGADVVLLDNMSPAELARAVGTIAGRAETEASGGVSLETVRAVAEAGVDRISIGALTHSAPALDVALDFEWEPAVAAGAPAQRS